MNNKELKPLKPKLSLIERYPDETTIRIYKEDRLRVKQYARQQGLKFPKALEKLLNKALIPNWL